LRVIILFFIFLFIPLIFLITGSIFEAPALVFLGVLINLILILIAAKILLFSLPISKSRVPEWADSFIRNTCFKLGVKKYGIFTSKGKNIYALDTFIGMPRVIIGDEFFDFFSKDECESLIFASFLRIQSKDSRFRSYSSVLINIFFLPFLKIPSQNIKISFLSFRHLIRSYLFKNKIELQSFDKKLGNYRIPFASALFKLKMLNDRNGFWIEDCAISETKTEEAIQYFFDVGYDFNDRYKDLLKENGKA
jgi:hypothetical protein